MSDKPVLEEDREALAERQFTRRIIALYKDSPVLWEHKKEHELDKLRREKALQKIIKKIQKVRPDYTLMQLKRKLNSLWLEFMKEKERYDEATNFGIPNNVVLPAFWYYEDLGFLAEEAKTKATQTTEPSQSQKKQQEITKYTQATQTDPKVVSETVMLMKIWLKKFEQLSDSQKFFAEKIISDVLFEGRKGTLTASNAYFQTTIPHAHQEPSVTPRQCHEQRTSPLYDHSSSQHLRPYQPEPYQRPATPFPCMTVARPPPIPIFLRQPVIPRSCNYHIVVTNQMQLYQLGKEPAPLPTTTTTKKKPPALIPLYRKKVTGSIRKK